MRQSIRFLRRGRVVEIGGLDPRSTLLDYLRLAERSVGRDEQQVLRALAALEQAFGS